MKKGTSQKRSRPEYPKTWTDEQTASLARHFHLKPGLSVLDVGTSDGYALTTWGEFCQPRGKFTALVTNTKAIATVRKRVATAGLVGNVAVVEGRLDKLAFKDRSFDVVLAHDVLSEQKQPERVLDEMVRVAKRGGCIALFDYTRRSFFHNSWNNMQDPAFDFRMFAYGMGLRVVAGRRKLGQGDLGVGFLLPVWMEKRGLRNVDVRANEQVTWQAPPYRSPAAKASFSLARKELQMSYPEAAAFHKEFVKHAQAGGASPADARSWLTAHRRYFARLKAAVRNRRFATVTNQSMVCAWGFKP